GSLIRIRQQCVAVRGLCQGP
ncbi:MAG: hypothetical protein AVDCRST_MAG93-1286, partial [uncultured Chloroflexia bacterium]